MLWPIYRAYIGLYIRFKRTGSNNKKENSKGDKASTENVQRGEQCILYEYINTCRKT